MHKTKRGAESGIKAEEFDRVLFEDQWSHLWPDGNVLEIREPTIRCNHLWLVQADREGFILPGKRRMGHDDGHIGKIHRDIVEVHRIGVFEMDTTTATHPCSYPRVSGVKHGRQTSL